MSLNESQVLARDQSPERRSETLKGGSVASAFALRSWLCEQQRRGREAFPRGGGSSGLLRASSPCCSEVSAVWGGWRDPGGLWVPSLPSPSHVNSARISKLELGFIPPLRSPEGTGACVAVPLPALPQPSCGLTLSSPPSTQTPPIPPAHILALWLPPPPLGSQTP